MTARHRFPARGPLVLAASLATALVPLLSSHAAVPGYMQENLVADQPNVAANTDPNLVNPWGIAFGPSTPFWISDNGTGVSTVYQANGKPAPATGPLRVTIPMPASNTTPPAGAHASPTGIVFNGTAGFALAAGQPALFLFASEEGTISGWNANVNMAQAVLKVDRSSSAVYKGLALLGDQLYAADFATNAIDVFNNDFSLAGSFTDPNVPAGFAPFGIQNLGGALYVTYAKQDDKKHDDVAGPGNGFVDLFDPASHAFTRVVSGGAGQSPLNSPWGLAIAPANFGPFSGDLLVGNFGDGRINAFDPKTGALKGQLADPNGQVIAIPGIWALAIAPSPDNAAEPSLYFTAGTGGEQHGLFGRLHAVGG